MYPMNIWIFGIKCMTLSLNNLANININIQTQTKLFFLSHPITKVFRCFIDHEKQQWHKIALLRFDKLASVSYRTNRSTGDLLRVNVLCFL